MIEFSVFIVALLAMLFGIISFVESDQQTRRFGYRVKSVKVTALSWQFSNKLFGSMLVSTGAIALVVGIILNSYMRLLSVNEIVVINVIELIVIVIISVVVTELRVKQVFDKEGNKK